MKILAPSELDKIAFKNFKGNSIPLIIEAQDNHLPLSRYLATLNSHLPLLKERLLKHGGLLFRNFPLNKVDDFIELIQNLSVGKFVNYIGGDSPRTKIKRGVYTSTEAPPSIKIFLHNELSFAKNYPRYIHFYCEDAPVDRGSTLIADARHVYQSLDVQVRNLFAEKQLSYLSSYYCKSPLLELISKWQKGHRSWPEVFETESKEEIEQICYQNDISFKWNQNDWLQLKQIGPAILSHPETKETCWFNQAHLFDFNPRFLGWWRFIGTKMLYIRDYMRLHEVSFADGSKIPRSHLYHIMDVLDKNTVYFTWQKGDVLVLDNILAMHGRDVFTGKRRILTAMTD